MKERASGCEVTEPVQEEGFSWGLMVSGGDRSSGLPMLRRVEMSFCSWSSAPSSLRGVDTARARGERPPLRLGEEPLESMLEVEPFRWLNAVRNVSDSLLRCFLIDD